MLGHRVLIAVLACATLVAANHPLPIRRVEDIAQDVEARADEPSYRLPNNTRPISYDVELTTHIHLQDNFNFNGKVAIRLTVVAASRSITLHHRQLTIGAATLALASTPASFIPLSPPVYDNVTEFLTYSLANGDLLVGSEYILTIEFTGIHREDQAGFYRSSYVSADGSRRWLATTQFESTDARHGFPCYDEPAFRALFTFHITHGSIYHAISNMNSVDSKPATTAGYTTTTFAVTAAPTPTYLLAFIVSDFEAKTKANANGFVQRVFARPNAIQDGDFGLDTGIKSLDAFEAYFGIPFAFPKMDQVAVPDFSAGAMENWGLVTYREDRLLYNENYGTFANKRAVATVIAHEYAHQWFGNLVTPKWWTYLWLNEGFATLYENYGTDWVFPEWKILDTFVFSVVQNVFVSDSTLATRPMTHYVESPRAVSQLFDSIAYSKSGSVLRMILNAFTEESFKKGVTAYLKLRTNSDSVEEDLFAELEKAVKADGTLSADYNVATIFSSWTRQAGYPIVNVQRNYETDDIVLTQERYLSTNSSTLPASTWWIPYNVATGSAANFDLTAATAWFSNTTATIKESTLQKADWLLLNKRQTGYYRVKYDLQNYKLLSEALVKNHSQIHLASRSQLIDDAFDLARTQRLSYDVPLDFIKYLEHEVEYVPWASAFRGLEYVDRLYAGNSDYAKFSTYLVKILGHIYNDAGLVAKPDEHHYRKQARNQVIQWACRHGSELCLNQTAVATNEFLTNNVAIHQDHRTTVLCNGIRTATQTQFNQLVSRLQSTVDEIERNRFIDALACSSNVNITAEYLQLTIAETSSLTETERYRAFFEVAGAGQASTKVAIQFLQANLDAVNTRYGRTNANRVITRVASFVVSDERTKEFNDLVTAAKTKAFIDEATITSATATLAANKLWIERNENDVHEWVKRNGSSHMIASAVLMAVLLFVSQLF